MPKKSKYESESDSSEVSLTDEERSDSESPSDLSGFVVSDEEDGAAGDMGAYSVANPFGPGENPMEWFRNTMNRIKKPSEVEKKSKGKKELTTKRKVTSSSSSDASTSTTKDPKKKK